MRVAYLDESYNKSYYWITALVCTANCIETVTNTLDKIVDDVANQYSLPSGIELHGHAMFHRKGGWENLEIRQAIGIYDKALRAIANTEIRIIERGVVRQNLVMEPHAVVLRYLFEDIDSFAEMNGFKVLTVADEVDSHQEHRRDLWHIRHHTTGGWKPRRIKQIVDTIHFCPSNESRMLQAADLVSFIQFRKKYGQDQDPRAIKAIDTLTDRITRSIEKSTCWKPKK